MENANFLPKIHRLPNQLQLEKTAAGNDSAQTPHSSSRLFALQNLVQDVIDDPDLMETEHEVMAAISVLHGAFQRSKKYSQSTQTPACMVQAPQPHQPSPCPKGIGSQTPPLPPIPDSRLEKAVFTHPSCARSHDATYDRLEILGDAYIELIATKMVWDRFPGIPSGRISQIRELLVRNETLAGFAQMYHLDQRALVPASHLDQAKRWTKTKGDIFEAYVAAVVLSHPTNGYRVVEEWLTMLWLPKINNLGHQKGELHSKEDLAKKVMGKGIKLEYLEERPSIHPKGTGSQTYFIGVYLTGWGWNKRHLGSGQGLSKTSAGDDAARDALQDTTTIAEITAAREMSMKGKQ